MQITIYYQSSLSNLVNNLVERIHKFKCKCKCEYKNDNRKCEKNEFEKCNSIQINSIKMFLS